MECLADKAMALREGMQALRHAILQVTFRSVVGPDLPSMVVPISGVWTRISWSYGRSAQAILDEGSDTHNGGVASNVDLLGGDLGGLAILREEAIGDGCLIHHVGEIVGSGAKLCEKGVHIEYERQWDAIPLLRAKMAARSLETSRICCASWLHVRRDGRRGGVGGGRWDCPMRSSHSLWCRQSNDI